MEAPPPIPARACRNCGSEAPDKFCANCGQMAKVRRRTLWMLIADFFAHSFAYDGRFWRTLIPLVVKPGRVTEQNLSERWVSYLPPLRIFLVISLCFFFALTSVLPNGIEEGKFFSVNGKPLSETEEVFEEGSLRVLSDDWIVTKWFNDVLSSKGEIINDMPPQLREFALYRGSIAAIPTTLLLAIPLFAFGLKVLHIFRRRYFFDHFVFATHFYSVWLLVLIPSILLGREWLWIAGHAIYLPVYLFIAMKRVYRQHWFPTLAKMILLGIWQIFSSIVLILTVFLSAMLHV